MKNVLCFGWMEHKIRSTIVSAHYLRAIESSEWLWAKCKVMHHRINSVHLLCFQPTRELSGPNRPQRVPHHRHWGEAYPIA